jgi:hypothetical protein
MDGSSLSPIIIPIVVMASLASWLIIVYWADSHPLWHHRPARRQADPQPSTLRARPHPSRESSPQRRAA